jgi:RNA polymerase sigma factor (sigma-70 family)
MPSLPAASANSKKSMLEMEAGGDAAAFEELFARHADAVYSHCLRRLDWARDDAKDAVSLVFLEIWRCRSRVTLCGGSLLPWLLGTATNVCRNTRRAARRYDAHLYRLPSPAIEPDHGDEVADRLDRQAKVRRLLARLNGGQRDVAELVLLAGLSYAEAATALGIPVSTVRTRHSRARQTLSRRRRHALLHHGDPGRPAGRSGVLRHRDDPGERPARRGPHQNPSRSNRVLRAGVAGRRFHPRLEEAKARRVR